MDLLEHGIIYKKESYTIIGACMEVHGHLGCGFLEAVYQEALNIELQKREIPFEQEKRLKIFYKDHLLSKKYLADFVCYDKIILEIKAIDKLKAEHMSQVINYLKITNYKLGLLVNFGAESLQYKRVVL
jgi:GxxExxY protein